MGACERQKMALRASVAKTQLHGKKTREKTLMRIHLRLEGIPSQRCGSTSASWGCSNLPSNLRTPRCNRKELVWQLVGRSLAPGQGNPFHEPCNTTLSYPLTNVCQLDQP